MGRDRPRAAQEIHRALLHLSQAGMELPHLEYRDLSPNDPNLLGVGEDPNDNYYRILIDRSQEEIVAKLEELKGLIERRS